MTDQPGPSPKHILLGYLSNRPALTDLVDDRIGSQTVDGTCVTYQLVPGGRVPQQQLRLVVQHRFLVKAWGADGSDGEDADLICRTVQAELSSPDFIGHQPTGGYVSAVDVLPQWEADDDSVPGEEARACQAFDLLITVKY